MDLRNKWFVKQLSTQQFSGGHFTAEKRGHFAVEWWGHLRAELVGHYPRILHTAPYMHDGRFATLDDVVAFYSKNVNLGSPNLDSNMQHFTNTNQMSATQRAHIVAFLKTLTDSSFISSPFYSQL